MLCRVAEHDQPVRLAAPAVGRASLLGLVRTERKEAFAAKLGFEPRIAAIKVEVGAEHRLQHVGRLVALALALAAIDDHMAPSGWLSEPAWVAQSRAQKELLSPNSRTVRGYLPCIAFT